MFNQIWAAWHSNYIGPTMTLTSKDQKAYEKWLNSHALMGSETLDNLEQFHQIVQALSETYTYVGRQISMVAAFLVVNAQLSGKIDYLLSCLDSQSDSRFEQEIENRLLPIYSREEVLMFMEACLFLSIEIQAVGRSLQIKPEDKSDINYSSVDLEHQASFINKLCVEDPELNKSIVIKTSEFKTIVSSCKHILKNMRFYGLLPQVLKLAKSGHNKKQIMDKLGLHQVQLYCLLDAAKDRDEKSRLLVESIQKRKSKPVKEEPQYRLTLSPSNYAYIQSLAAEQFNGNMYHAINTLITTFRDLVSKNVMQAEDVLNQPED